LAKRNAANFASTNFAYVTQERTLYARFRQMPTGSAVQTNMRDEAQIAPEAGSPQIAIYQGFFGRRCSHQNKNKAIQIELRQFMPQIEAPGPP
jgi:hypothetical protein